MYKELEGLKFPDESVVRWFFKEGLHAAPGTALELGCGNGCNLLLFADYGWKVEGVDINEASIRQARNNFAGKGFADAGFSVARMEDYVQTLDQESFDAILFPGTLYYLGLDEGIEILRKTAAWFKPGGRFYFRMRAFGDYRDLHGTRLSKQEVRLDFDETGESGCRNTFWESEEFVALLSDLWRPQKMVCLKHWFDNVQMGKVIGNRDFLVYGTL